MNDANDKDADEAPVTAEDVVKARVTHAVFRTVVGIFAGAVVLAAGLAVYEAIADAAEAEATAARRVAYWQRAVAGVKADNITTLHKGNGVAVVETAEFVALVEGGAVKAGALKR